MKQRKTAEIPEPYIPIFGSDKKTVLGRCTAGMTAAGVSRFTRKLGSTLQTVDGRKCWVAPKRGKK